MSVLNYPSNRPRFVFRDWLIKKLGGYTEREHKGLLNAYIAERKERMEQKKKFAPVIAYPNG